MTLSDLCYGGVGGRELLRSLRRADNQVWGSRLPKLHQQQALRAPLRTEARPLR
jgi:hypothetical protein